MIRRVLSGALGSLIAALSLTACGTATFNNEFTVSVTDPRDRLGTDEVQVSVFDPQMGFPERGTRTAESIGVTTAGQPYSATVFTTDTKMIGDSSPPRTVSVGVYLPQLQGDGYYGVRLDPADGATVDYLAPFVSFNAGYEAPGEKRKTAPPLPMRITSVAGDNGWEIAIIAEVS
ncbi:MAG: hypothetical protein V9E98_02400 [Candidatus Nanopelagicales bacterium]